MTTHVGLWIDHRKAVIVVVSDEGEATRLVTSQVGKHVRFSGGTGSAESHRSQKGTGEDTRERRRDDQLSRYYNDVIAHIRGAVAILIFGPGEAKVELKARLERDGLGASVVGVETVDKMTDRQIAAKVRERFRS
jgi:hypothetical protein